MTNRINTAVSGRVGMGGYSVVSTRRRLNSSRLQIDLPKGEREPTGERQILRLRLEILVSFLFLVFSAVSVAAQPTDPHVIRFSPQGTVKGVRQVSARFSEPMVPLGDPRSTIDPFEITCSESGTARWVDSRTWVYDFTHDLPGGMRCTFRLRPHLTSLAGKEVTGQQEFAF